MLLIVAVIGAFYFALATYQEVRQFKIPLREGAYLTAALNCSLPVVPAEVPVLSVVRRNFTDAEAEAIAREVFGMTGKFNVTGHTVSLDGKVVSFVSVMNGTQDIELYEDGALIYRPGSEKTEYGIKLPEFQQAKEIAYQFLEGFIEKATNYGLMPKLSPHIEFSDVDYVAWWGITPLPIVPIEIRVSYKVLYNGMPLVGKGSVYVTIGDNGNVLDFHCFWRNLEFADALPITVSPEQAILNMGNNSLTGRDPRKIQSITINSIELGYFTPAPIFAFTELLPAYEIEFVASFEDGSEDAYVTYVSATDTPIP